MNLVHGLTFRESLRSSVERTREVQPRSKGENPGNEVGAKDVREVVGSLPIGSSSFI